MFGSPKVSVFGHPEALGLASAISGAVCAGSLHGLTPHALNLPGLVTLGGLGLASVAFGCWVRQQMHNRLSAQDDVIWVYGRSQGCNGCGCSTAPACCGRAGIPGVPCTLECCGGKLVGRLDEDAFLQILKSKHVSLHTLKARRVNPCFQREADISYHQFTHAIFIHCAQTEDLYDMSKHPFFYHAQLQKMVLCYHVPLAMFYRLSERMKESRCLLVPNPGRCGSTLLCQLVNLHPNVTTISEVVDIPALQVLASSSHVGGLRYTGKTLVGTARWSRVS